MALAGDVAAAFQARFGAAPADVAVAPGRVNLIGEHIDYEGYSVLPMALQQACCVAIGPAGPPGSTTVAGADPAAYPERRWAAWDAAGAQRPPAVESAGGAWQRYVLAAAHGVWEHLSGGGGGGGGGGVAEASSSSGGSSGAAAGPGLCLMVGSSIPPGAGLSSSSALVVASALALLAARGATVPPNAVADLARRCERLVGTMGGGMDQAISLLAQPGRAMLIGFNPLTATPVTLPPGAAFVVANSLAPSLKAETADSRFNLRVVECRLAAALLSRKLGSPPSAAAAVRTLRQVEPPIAAAHGPGLEGQLAAVRGLLRAGAYSQEQIEAELGLPLETVFASEPAPLRVLAAARPLGFRLRDRAEHVFSEAVRVLALRDVCEAAGGASGGDADAALRKAGELMNASHASCSQLYGCSCPELDQLVALARGAGALGARLTGAGWGGCVVALARESEAAALFEALRRGYYERRGLRAPSGAADACSSSGQRQGQGPDAGSGRGSGNALFATRPAGGARVIGGDELATLLLSGGGQPAAAAAAPAERQLAGALA